MAAAAVTDEWLPPADDEGHRCEEKDKNNSNQPNNNIADAGEKKVKKKTSRGTPINNLNKRLASCQFLTVETEFDVWTGHALEECDDNRNNYQELERHRPRVYFLDTTTPGHKPRPLEDPEPNCVIREVKEMNIVGDGEKAIVVMFKGRQVFYKCSKDYMVNERMWRASASVFMEALKIQRPTERRASGNHQCEGDNISNHVRFGFWKDPLTGKVRTYPPKKEMDATRVSRMHLYLRLFFSAFQTNALLYITKSEWNYFNQLRAMENLHRVSLIGEKRSYFTEMSIAYQHWSPVESDSSSYYRKALSCYSVDCMRDEGDKNQILYYIIFPSLGLAVPMKSRDMLVFDPSFPHCASNHQMDDSVLLSFVANAKTLNAQIASNHEASEQAGGKSCGNESTVGANKRKR